MDFGLKDKVAIVTGAGSQIGFGHETALTLAREGCHIVAADMDLPGAEQTASQVEVLGRKAIAVKVNITDRKEVKKMVDVALEKFGKIDILVNNAGIGRPGPFDENTDDDDDANIDVNLKGMVNCTRAVINHMRSRKSGKIVSISSVSGIGGTAGAAVYSAAKAGVVIITKALGVEYAAMGININSVAPGLGLTNFVKGAPEEFLETMRQRIPNKRTTTPQDIANTVAFLASDVSSNIVGQTISVAGGQTGTESS